jgi:hypothetical protein
MDRDVGMALLGAIFGFVVSWWFAKKATADLVKATADLRLLHNLTLYVLTNLDHSNIKFELVRDQHGNIVGIKTPTVVRRSDFFRD